MLHRAPVIRPTVSAEHSLSWYIKSSSHRWAGRHPVCWSVVYRTWIQSALSLHSARHANQSGILSWVARGRPKCSQSGSTVKPVSSQLSHNYGYKLSDKNGAMYWPGLYTLFHLHRIDPKSPFDSLLNRKSMFLLRIGGDKQSEHRSSPKRLKQWLKKRFCKHNGSKRVRWALTWT